MHRYSQWNMNMTRCCSCTQIEHYLFPFLRWMQCVWIALAFHVIMSQRLSIVSTQITLYNKPHSICITHWTVCESINQIDIWNQLNTIAMHLILYWYLSILVLWTGCFWCCCCCSCCVCFYCIDWKIDRIPDISVRFEAKH